MNPTLFFTFENNVENEGMCFLDEVLIPKLYSLNKDTTKPSVLSSNNEDEK